MRGVNGQCACGRGVNFVRARGSMPVIYASRPDTSSAHTRRLRVRLNDASLSGRAAKATLRLHCPCMACLRMARVFAPPFRLQYSFSLNRRQHCRCRQHYYFSPSSSMRRRRRRRRRQCVVAGVLFFFSSLPLFHAWVGPACRNQPRSISTRGGRDCAEPRIALITTRCAQRVVLGVGPQPPRRTTAVLFFGCLVPCAQCLTPWG